MKDDERIIHSGVAHDDDPPGRGSGRFGWGTGENPGQHQHDFLSQYQRLKKKGLTDAVIAKMLLGENATTTHLRAERSIAVKQQRQIDRARAIKLLNECNGNVSEVGRRMGKNESSIRSLLDPVIAERTDRYENTAEFLKKKVAENGIVDVSNGQELFMGVPSYTKKVALAMLEKEGYVTANIPIDQVGTGKQTYFTVLAPPGMEYKEIYANRYNIKPFQDWTPDEGKTFWTPEFPESLNSKRVMVRYAEEGGKLKDGVIELKKGVEDISLGGSQYSQVRIAVDGTHYMKGMAIYGDPKDFPKGVDVIYNTNKHTGTPMLGPENNTVMKKLKIDKGTGEVDRDNPFGALIKGPKEKDGLLMAGGQRHYIDKDGVERLSPINKLQDEGDWDNWSRNLASQFLSKQPLKLIKQQLDISVKDKKAELDEIMNLTNPVIKKKLLEEFASGCDANADDLSAKGFKKQAFQVLLPITNMKDNECYAPNYQDGDTVALIRYPHGGPFEIPILKVNNKHESAKKIMGNAKDAIGINEKVAERLSGADFDGDTALVIPLASNRINVKSTRTLPGLDGFDQKESYKLPDSAPKMKNSTKQKQMGIVTNLITDMSVQGASEREIEKAVRHSMVVIDAEKHHLDYKQSAKDNDIYELSKTYQTHSVNGKEKQGASTVLSRAKAQTYVNQRKEVTDRNKMTPAEQKAFDEGKKIYHDTGRTKKVQVKDPDKMTPAELEIYKAGKKVYRESTKKVQEKVHQMDTVDDAMDLVRDPSNQKEVAYANYANSLKSLANAARKEARSIKPTPINPKAKETYASEVASLNDKVTRANMNKPKERQAQIIANATTQIKFADNPDMDYEHKQRIRSQALTQARAMVGAKKDKVTLTEREWEAIQANAISSSKLSEIINNMDSDELKKLATPRGNDSIGLSASDIARIKAMYSSGLYTNKDIADALGVSTSTVSAYANE